MTLKYEPVYLENNPYYSFTTALNKVAYNIKIRYSTREFCWYMDIKTNDNVPIVLSTKLVPNYPMLSGLFLGNLGGYFFLLPVVESNLYKLQTEPENIADYFQLFYVYDAI